MKPGPLARSFLLLTGLLLLLPGTGHVSGTPSPAGEPAPERYHSAHLDGEIVVLPGVFFPTTAEHRVLPFMRDNADRFEGAVVLDIGTGSGIIALYAAKLGAKKVIATDISETALRCTSLNAERFGFSRIIEPRLVPATDMSAYSVIEPGERFDLVISNPPYFLDYDAPAATHETDTGDLGFSIIRGLDRHLAPEGRAVLLYGSTFYHQIIAKFARHRGYAVENHDPGIIYADEILTLCNSYLARILEREGLEPEALRFDKGDITALVPRKKMLEDAGDRSGPYYSGLILIRAAEAGGN